MKTDAQLVSDSDFKSLQEQQRTGKVEKPLLLKTVESAIASVLKELVVQKC